MSNPDPTRPHASTTAPGAPAPAEPAQRFPYQSRALAPSERLEAAVRAVEAILVAEGVPPAEAAALAERTRGGITLDAQSGTLKFARPDVRGFYTPGFNPLRRLVADLVAERSARLSAPAA